MNTILYISFFFKKWAEGAGIIQCSIYFIMRGFPSPTGSFVKFILDHIFTVAIVVLSGGALLWPALRPSGRRATVLQVTQLLNRGKTALVDVRSAEEFAAGHLRDAKNIPLADLATRVGELDKSKNKTVVVICEAGARSDKAARQLTAAGFEDVVSLEGGLAAWRAAGLPVTK
jgi:rhodanese-related sulfurtransferase